MLIGEVRVPVRAHEQRERGSRPDAVHLDAVERGAWRAARPATAEQHDMVPVAGQPSEDFMEMNLSAAGEWVFPALPVDDGDPQPVARTCGGSGHKRPSLRA